MDDKSLSYTIRDPEVIAKMKQVAAGQNEKNWRRFARRTFERLTRSALGLDADMTTKEAAAQLKCTVKTIFTYKRQGLFPNAYYINARQLRITCGDVEKLRQRTVGI
jgi:DNA-binding CsgD family transcriptional regulator